MERKSAPFFSVRKCSRIVSPARQIEAQKNPPRAGRGGPEEYSGIASGAFQAPRIKKKRPLGRFVMNQRWPAMGACAGSSSTFKADERSAAPIGSGRCARARGRQQTARRKAIL